MKIIRLAAENVKRLVAVEITPKGNVIEITGKNGAGKTSVLDSIWWALAGNRTHQAVPVRQGETEAVISLDLGDIKVRREFSVREPLAGAEAGPAQTITRLFVESAQGARYPSPQKMLDELVGSLTFDPLAFSRMPPKDKLAVLRGFVTGVDFAEEAAADRLRIPAAPGPEPDGEGLAGCGWRGSRCPKWRATSRTLEAASAGAERGSGAQRAAARRHCGPSRTRGRNVVVNSASEGGRTAIEVRNWRRHAEQNLHSRLQGASVRNSRRPRPSGTNRSLTDCDARGPRPTRGTPKRSTQERDQMRGQREREEQVGRRTGCCRGREQAAHRSRWPPARPGWQRPSPMPTCRCPRCP